MKYERESTYLGHSNLKTKKLSGEGKLSILYQTAVVSQSYTSVLSCSQSLHTDLVPKAQLLPVPRLLHSGQKGVLMGTSTHLLSVFFLPACQWKWNTSPVQLCKLQVFKSLIQEHIQIHEGLRWKCNYYKTHWQALERTQEEHLEIYRTLNVYNYIFRKYWIYPQVRIILLIF